MMPASKPMACALEAARAVRGQTSPNPWVGAVIVRGGAIAGVGATEPPGGRHAEAAALAAAPGRGGTLYVTLEPCVPFPGKRTRSCAEAIVEAGIERVVVALEDPDPNVRGRGVALLREAGVTVDVGDGCHETASLLRPYLKHRQTGLPYVIAKFASSLDGRIATRTGDSKWITGGAARDLAHRQRAWVDAVMVGSGTVLADDPALTARPGGELASRQPLRVVLDSRGRVQVTARLFQEPGRVVVATTCQAGTEWKRAVTAAGGEIVECEPGADGGLRLESLLALLGQRGTITVWAEGGGQLLGSLFAGGHVDEVWAFLAPRIIGGDGLPAVAGVGAETIGQAWQLRETAVEEVGTDILVRGYAGEWSP